MPSKNTKQENQESFKMLPRNDDAERNFIGSLILDGRLLEKVREALGHVDADYFFNQKHRIIYNEILNRAATTDDFNVTVLCADLESKGLLNKAGGVAYVAGLTELTGPQAAVVEYGKIVVETAQRRNLIAVAEHIQEIAYNPNGKAVSEIYDEAQGAVFGLSEKNASENSGPQDISTVALNLVRTIRSDMNSNKKMQGVSSGFRELDNLTSGLRGGTLNIIAARPAVGKTSFAMNLVANIAMSEEVKYPALVFSLEMPAKEIAMRMLSSFGRVSTKDLVSAKVKPEQWHNILRKVKLLTRTDSEGGQHVKLYIDDTSDIALTPLELRSRARKIVQEQGGLSVIMVDYIQLMKSQTKLDNRAQEVGEISRSLKQLSKELDVPILALAQLNRAVEERNDHIPMNSDLRESGSLEQDADMIMFLHRDDVYKPANVPKDGKAELIISKNRSGATASIELQFQADYTTFYDPEDNTVESDKIPVASEIYQ